MWLGVCAHSVFRSALFIDRTLRWRARIGHGCFSGGGPPAHARAPVRWCALSPRRRGMHAARPCLVPRAPHQCLDEGAGLLSVQGRVSSIRPQAADQKELSKPAVISPQLDQPLDRRLPDTGPRLPVLRTFTLHTCHWRPLPCDTGRPSLGKAPLAEMGAASSPVSADTCHPAGTRKTTSLGCSQGWGQEEPSSLCGPLPPSLWHSLVQSDSDSSCRPHAAACTTLGGSAVAVTQRRKFPGRRLSSVAVAFLPFPACGASRGDVLSAAIPR